MQIIDRFFLRKNKFIAHPGMSALHRMLPWRDKHRWQQADPSDEVKYPYVRFKYIKHPGLWGSQVNWQESGACDISWPNVAPAEVRKSPETVWYVRWPLSYLMPGYVLWAQKIFWFHYWV